VLRRGFSEEKTQKRLGMDSTVSGRQGAKKKVSLEFAALRDEQRKRSSLSTNDSGQI